MNQNNLWTTRKHISLKQSIILIVVDDGLVQFDVMSNAIVARCLNPCCSGRWSRTKRFMGRKVWWTDVLILVVVDDGLVHTRDDVLVEFIKVLILIVVEDGLVPYKFSKLWLRMTCLNPCCSGQWSSTKGELNKNVADYVLILVVVEDGLVPS